MASICFSKTFDTEVEADKFIEQYKEAYHPAGYGTSCVKIPKDDKIVVRVHRFDSCD